MVSKNNIPPELPGILLILRAQRAGINNPNTQEHAAEAPLIVPRIGRL